MYKVGNKVLAVFYRYIPEKIKCLQEFGDLFHGTASSSSCEKKSTGQKKDIFDSKLFSSIVRRSTKKPLSARKILKSFKKWRRRAVLRFFWSYSIFYNKQHTSTDLDTYFCVNPAVQVPAEKKERWTLRKLRGKGVKSLTSDEVTIC